MNWTVDRIEGNYVIVEFEGQFYEIPLQLLPNVQEGDMINVEITDNSEARTRIQTKLFKLFKGESE